MKRIVQILAIGIVIPLLFEAFLMWMLRLQIDDLSPQAVVLGAGFWIIVAYVPWSYSELKHRYSKAYEEDGYNRLRSRADTLLGAGVIGLILLLAQAVLSSP